MIGQKIKKLRKERHLTQEELSDMMGIKQPQLNRWKTEKLSPSLNAIKKLSEIFNISIDTLAFDSKQIKKLTPNDQNSVSKLKGFDKLSGNDKEMVSNLILSLANK